MTGRGLGARAVRQGDPALGHDHVERERGLQVGLVEAGEDPLRLVQEALAEEIRLAVLGIDRAMDPLAALRVSALRLDDEFIRRLESVEGDALAIVGIDEGELATVQPDRSAGRCQELDERRSTRHRALESDACPGLEPRPVGGHVKLDLVRDATDQAGAFGRLLARQGPHHVILPKCHPARDANV